MALIISIRRPRMINVWKVNHYIYCSFDLIFILDIVSNITSWCQTYLDESMVSLLQYWTEFAKTDVTTNCTVQSCPDCVCSENVSVPLACPSLNCPEVPKCPDLHCNTEHWKCPSLQCPDIPSCPDLKCNTDHLKCPSLECHECPLCPDVRCNTEHLKCPDLHCAPFDSSDLKAHMDTLFFQSNVSNSKTVRN